MSALRMDDSGVVISCEGCGQKNRIPFARLAEQGACGKCQARLPALAEPVDVATDSQFERLTRESAVPVLVDFWAAWCGPCRMMAPEYAKAAQSLAGELVLVKVNSDLLTDTAARYRIQSLPTLALFSGGREVAREMGARPAAAIVSMARMALSAPGT